MVDSRHEPAANVPARSQAPRTDSRGRRGNIRPFNDMERDRLLAGYRGWLPVN